MYYVIIYNKWLVLHCRIESKIFDVPINIEPCSLVKAMKYICKYASKDSDQAVFNIYHEGRAGQCSDEVQFYKSSIYVSSNEAI